MTVSLPNCVIFQILVTAPTGPVGITTCPASNTGVAESPLPSTALTGPTSRYCGTETMVNYGLSQAQIISVLRTTCGCAQRVNKFTYSLY